MIICFYWQLHAKFNDQANGSLSMSFRLHLRLMGLQFHCVFWDTGYPHNGRADNAAYRHDRCADKRRYRHDREIDF